MRKTLFFFLFTLLIATQVPAQYIHLTEEEDLTAYTPTGRPRVAAEWEPAIGVLISWPLWIPKDLVLELAKDTRLYIVSQGISAQKAAVAEFTKWGIKPNQVKFIPAPLGDDAAWTRDWGPAALFSTDGIMKLADGKYIYSTPVSGMQCEDSLRFIYMDAENKIIRTNRDDRIPDFISQFTGYDVVYLPFAFTGGNVISDGQRTAFSTCIMTNENRYSGVSDEKFFTDVHQVLGLKYYNIISNFELEGIQHIDCFMKMLDEERLLVMRPPLDHPLYEQYEGIINNELKFLKNAYGRPYEILRLDTKRYQDDDLAAYSNSLILNKVIYVPLFNIPQDEIAIQQWKDAMPGYTVKGFKFNIASEKVLDQACRDHYKTNGWRGTDALHCRTRAIWDPEMIYISVNRLPAKVDYAKRYAIDVIIKDYSGRGFLPDQIHVKWKKSTDVDWKDSQLIKTELDDHFKATIPENNHGVTIQYYVEATSISGKSQTMPVVAPGGFYSFTVGSGKK